MFPGACLHPDSPRRSQPGPDDGSGQLSVDALAEMLDDRVKLVAMSWIPTQGGLVNPAAAAGDYFFFGFWQDGPL